MSIHIGGRTAIAMLRTFVLLSALLVLFLAATAEPAPAVSGSPPLGLVVVIENKPQQLQLNLQAINNPSISGVALQIRWRDLEPAQGQPDWSKLDQLFAAAESSHKWVQLLLFPGFFSPAWALEGVQTEMFPIQYGPGKGSVERLPMPWDRTYLNRWFDFLRLLSARYGKSPALRVIAASGPTSVSAEYTLPSNPEDVRKWLALGYTPHRYLEAWRQVLQFYAATFPNQYISLSLGFGLNINDRGKLDATARQRTKLAMIDQAMSLLSGRFVLQYSNLDGNPGPDKGPPGTELILSYNGRIITGFQLRTSCLRNSENMGATSDPQLALKRSLAKGLQPNASGHRVNYIEIYEPDVLAPEMQPVLRDAAAQFK
ncbi:MAG TPA: hypothetical protein VEJ47_05855 [Candidatus Eremiobacteraceae bacterium]|nr:hypothetical protein [Candidatus Eremiobacteraceae bacterium]